MMKKQLQPCPLLLVQSTGGGKSAVPQRWGCTIYVITTIFENTQALGADQKSKLNNCLENNRIWTIELDLIKSISQLRFVIETIGLIWSPSFMHFHIHLFITRKTTSYFRCVATYCLCNYWCQMYDEVHHWKRANQQKKHGDLTTLNILL
jgi:hypothetical protein